LENIAILLGLPGKLGFSGAQVWNAWVAGDIGGIRRYCETDVLNTYLIFLSFQRMRGQLETPQWEAEQQRVRTLLQESSELHHREFLRQWAGEP
jgi:predicted PolB exonuclease-like 3'-5' exonuclease